MKKSYLLVLLSIVLFIVGCQSAETPPAATPPAATTPPPAATPPAATPPAATPPPAPDVDIPDVPEVATAGDIVIKDQTVEPTELTVAAGTEVSISVEGKTPHTILIDKGIRTIANLGVLADGDSITYIFEETGDYKVRSLRAGNVRVVVTVE